MPACINVVVARSVEEGPKRATLRSRQGRRTRLGGDQAPARSLLSCHRCRWVDPDGCWCRRWLRRAGGEAFRVQCVGAGKGLGPRGDACGGEAVVDVVWGEQTDSAVTMFLVVPGKKNRAQWARASAREPKRSGKSGRCFRVLKWASENGLSLETCGREWLFETPRSA